MELTRHQGLGNVFLIALLEDLPDNPSEIARKSCAPINGIGADGLIIGTGSQHYYWDEAGSIYL